MVILIIMQLIMILLLLLLLLIIIITTTTTTTTTTTNTGPAGLGSRPARRRAGSRAQQVGTDRQIFVVFACVIGLVPMYIYIYIYIYTHMLSLYVMVHGETPPLNIKILLESKLASAAGGHRQTVISIIIVWKLVITQ